METTAHKYVTVAYDLYTDNAEGIHELMEKAPAEHPFCFISGMGITLDSFEQKILGLQPGETFDFVLKEDEAYGKYMEDRVLERDKSFFHINGKFDEKVIYAGAVLPLVNEDGNRFDGLVLDVTDKSVIIDLNHPFAGKDLHFKGRVIEMRDATDQEIKHIIQMLSGEGCSGCCGGECEGECGSGKHAEGEGCCCGKEGGCGCH